jgi:aryl-alcohol dehydrogenase-like predicted oxidoreductase
MINKTITIGNHTNHPLLVNRVGYGTMRLTGEGFYGEPKDRANAIAILRKAVESGVNFFDTADFYGPGVTNKLLADALYPYSKDIIIATKVGAKRGDDKSWQHYDRPQDLRESVENNLRELKLEYLPLVHYGKSDHSPSDYEEGFSTMLEMQKEGKILHLGLSNVSLEKFHKAIDMGEVVSIENLFSYAQRTTDPHSEYGFKGGEVLPLCEDKQIVFIPFFSLQTSLPVAENKMAELAIRKGVTVAQLNIAWMLHHSNSILPIPGTTSIDHLTENINAQDINLSADEMNFLG